MNSKNGARFQSDLSNRGGYKTGSGKTLWLKNHCFSRNTATVTVISFPMVTWAKRGPEITERGSARQNKQSPGIRDPEI